MTREGIPAVFVIPEVAAVRAAQGACDAAVDSIIGPILQPPADRRCPREERPRKRDRESCFELNQSRVTGKPD